MFAGAHVHAHMGSTCTYAHVRVHMYVYTCMYPEATARKVAQLNVQASCAMRHAPCAMHRAPCSMRHPASSLLARAMHSYTYTCIQVAQLEVKESAAARDVSTFVESLEAERTKAAHAQVMHAYTCTCMHACTCVCVHDLRVGGLGALSLEGFHKRGDISGSRALLYLELCDLYACIRV